MFESVTSMLGGIKNFFSSGYAKASEFVHGAYNKVTGTVTSVVGTIYSDAKGGIAGAGSIVNNVISGTKDVANNIVTGTKEVIQSGQKVIGDTITNAASSLSMPLVIVGGIFGFLMLNKK